MKIDFDTYLSKDRGYIEKYEDADFYIKSFRLFCAYKVARYKYKKGVLFTLEQWRKELENYIIYYSKNTDLKEMLLKTITGFDKLSDKDKINELDMLFDSFS